MFWLLSDSKSINALSLLGDLLTLALPLLPLHPTKPLRKGLARQLSMSKKIGTVYIDGPSGSLPEALFTGTLSNCELTFCVGPFLIFSQIHSLTFSSKIYFPGSFANYLLIRFSSWKALAGDWSRKKIGNSFLSTWGVEGTTSSMGCGCSVIQTPIGRSVSWGLAIPPPPLLPPS